MHLRIVCKARYLSAYMKYLLSTYGKDCLVVNLNPILQRKGVKLNEHKLQECL